MPASYPVNLVVEGRPVLVVGGGAVAESKARGLVAAGAHVTVVAPAVAAAIRSLGVTVEERPYQRGEVAHYRLAVACTDDTDTNQAVYDDGEAAGVWVNAADDPARCSYTLPARAERWPLRVTVSTEGRSPTFAAWLRDDIAGRLGPEHDTLLDLLATTRRGLPTDGERPPASSWRAAVDSGMLDLIRSGRVDEAREVLHHHLGLDPATPPVPRQGAHECPSSSSD